MATKKTVPNNPKDAPKVAPKEDKPESASKETPKHPMEAISKQVAGFSVGLTELLLDLFWGGGYALDDARMERDKGGQTIGRAILNAWKGGESVGKLVMDFKANRFECNVTGLVDKKKKGGGIETEKKTVHYSGQINE